jgi:solute carrier family 25 protein 38
MNLRRATAITPPTQLIKTRLQQGDASLRTKSALPVLMRTILTFLSVQSSRCRPLHHAVDRLFLRGTRSLARHILIVNPVPSDVPGIALYFTSSSQVRGFMAAPPIFTAAQKRESGRHSSVLPMLTSSGNLLAGATTRVAVGFALNPLSVLKARYEVRTLSARSPPHAIL